ncbi:hypothetical protein [Parasynechococcus sp.]|uniref:hypothetical protein n=1 Tax=Parasynechococcus sp. TaxID=3101203 RepID=UPI003704D478
MLLKLISCGSLALVSVLVVTLLQGLRQHNQRIHALQERIDQLEEHAPNRAHSNLLSRQIGCDAGTHGCLLGHAHLDSLIPSPHPRWHWAG